MPLSGAAAPSGFDTRIESVERTTNMVEGRLTRLEREYGHRRGLIGAEEAESRYEDAVFAYLVEDYERAATIFFTLVEAEALVRPRLARDSEWYLGECLFEEGNYLTSVEAYERIIEAGRAHPFFNDAVRRQLEAFGRLKDTGRFYQVYNRFIVTGIVPTTDAVKYSIAKSFYHQGDAARAKGLFSEIPKESRHYTRARYFMGAILVSEGQLEAALSQFETSIYAADASTELPWAWWNHGVCADARGGNRSSRAGAFGLGALELRVGSVRGCATVLPGYSSGVRAFHGSIV
jgi:tetratricopeptide (TPR) repeat protein